MSQMLKSSGSMAAATLTSRVLGMVREMVYYSFMGTGWVNDAFQYAFTVPNLFRRLLGEGLSALESVTAPALDRMGGKSGRSKAALLGSVMDEVLERRSARRAAAAA